MDLVKQLAYDVVFLRPGTELDASSSDARGRSTVATPDRTRAMVCNYLLDCTLSPMSVDYR